MESKDLRIGNFVGLGIEIYKVQALYHKQVTLEDKITGSTKHTVNLNHYPNSVKPIPLTEEWLVKFGLNDKYYFAGDLRLIEDEEEGCYLSSEHHCGFDLPTVKHVHQLQNLYHALTGEELTINN